MFKSKPFHAFLVLLAVAGGRLASASVIQFDPAFADPDTIYDVGSDDPTEYQWVNDPTLPNSSFWEFFGSGVTAMTHAAVWAANSEGATDSQVITTNNGQPYFAVIAGATAPTFAELPIMCRINMHCYGVLEADASWIGTALATARAQVGVSIATNPYEGTVDLGVKTVTVSLAPDTVHYKQPTVVGTSPFSGLNLMTTIFNSTGDPVSDNSAYAYAEVKYTIVSWSYTYPRSSGGPVGP